MKPATAANLCLALAALALALGWTGLNADYPSEWIAGGHDAEVRAKVDRQVYMVCGAVLCALCGFWLSGYAWAGARGRAAVALAGCVLFLASLVRWML